MKTFISLVSLLACAALDAQIIGTLNRSPDGLEEIRIRNNSAISVVAFAVYAKQVPRSDFAGNPPLVVYSDPFDRSVAEAPAGR